LFIPEITFPRASIKGLGRPRLMFVKDIVVNVHLRTETGTPYLLATDEQAI